MRNRLLIFSFICIFSMSFVYSQKFLGKYTNGYNFLDFKSDSLVDFNINSGGGISYNYQGAGNYKVTDGFLQINLVKLTSTYTIVKPMNELQKSDNLTVFVNDAETGKPFSDFLGVALMKNQKVIAHSSLKNGKVQFPLQLIGDSVELVLRYVGYPSFSFPLPNSTSTDYLVEFSANPSFESTRAFLRDDGNGFKIEVNKDKISLHRLEPISVRTRDSKDKQYRWIEFVKGK